MLTNDSIKNIDVNILLSIINTKLRECYSSLDDLSNDLEIDKGTIINRLNEVDKTYDFEQNKFL